MVDLTLPDGTIRHFPEPVTGGELATDISPGLAREALAIMLDGELQDLSRPLAQDGTVRIVTRRDGDDVVLPLLRHDAAHVLAQATQELFPDTQITFGPATQDGFYYDFARETPFSGSDIEQIEQRMHDIVDRKLPILRDVWSRDHAVTFFREQGEIYKAEHIANIPEDEEIRIYRQGEWLDLCRGPHLPHTGLLGHGFKLTKISGAYWRGDPNNPQLQRVYGVCWRDKKELAAYLHRIEQAERRDHRRIGREMGLFHIQEEAIGSIFWHAKGWKLWRICEDHLRARLDDAGYQEIRTPQLVDRSLWEASGHWDKFREHMFVTEIDEIDTKASGSAKEGRRRVMALKPMNCPCHVQIFRSELRSYRQLPLRLSEFGSCHRYEPSGALHGLMRVRAFTQDDAHIFCTEEQVASETEQFIQLLRGIYRDFGFTDVRILFSDRPANRHGADELWDKAEASLREATEAAGEALEINPGEGAFYGPKLEFILSDAIGRSWQCGTLQVDFVLPERLDASYIDSNGQSCRPVMLHRAILGSFERFIGILIEHYAGRFPLWLAPIQVMLATVTEASNAYAEAAALALRQAGLRVETDLTNNTIAYKIRTHSLAKIPVIAIIGAREAELATLTFRYLGHKQQETLALSDACAKLAQESAPPTAMDKTKAS